MMKKKIGLAVAFLLVGILTSASAREHILLSLPGIKGEFYAGEYIHWIEIVAFEHNIPGLPKPLALLSGAQPGQPTGAFTYPAASRPFEMGSNWTGVALAKWIDKATPQLAYEVKQGRTGFPSMKLNLCSLESGGDVRLLISLNFEEIKIVHREIMEPGSGDRSGMLKDLDPNKSIEIIYLQPTKVTWSTGDRR